MVLNLYENMTNVLKERKIRDIIYETKPPLVKPEDTLAHARNLGIRCKKKTIIVVDEEEKPIGTLSLYELGKVLLNKSFYTKPLDRLIIADFMEKEMSIVPEESFLVDAAKMMLEEKSELIIVDKNSVVVGLLEADDLLAPYSRLSESEKIVEEVYIKNPSTAHPLHSIKYAYDIMGEEEKDAVIVIDQLKRPVGIVTYTDISYLPHIYFSKRSKYIKGIGNRVLYVKYSLPVLEDIMSSPVYVTYLHEKLVEAARQMYIQRIGHLPVVDNDNKVVGIIDKYVILEDILREGL